MKRLMVATALACVLMNGAVFAQTGNVAKEQGAAPQTAMKGDAAQKPAAPMGPGMMRHGGMGPGMMGGGMGPGMMGGGMGPCGMMDGMMGPGIIGDLAPEDQQKYLDATRELRKKLHDKKFEYGEAARNPKTGKADLLKMKKEMWDLQQDIEKKAWEFMKE